MTILKYEGKKVNIKIECSGLNNKETQLINTALGIMGDRINSDEFERFVKTFSWEKRLYKWRWFRKVWYTQRGGNFRYNKGLSQEQIYNKIMSGAETLDPVKDREIDIYLKVDRRNKRGVIGYMYPGQKWQWIYSWVLRKYDKYGVAANLAHEYCHHLSFHHERKYNPLRQYTVPYSIGSYFDNLRYHGS